MIGIIGPGVVGRAIGRYYEKRNYVVMYFDKDDQVIPCDLFFICVPTPHGDDSAILDAIKRVPKGSKAIVKSTMNPSIKLPNNFIYQPEFLSDITAEADFEAELPASLHQMEAILLKYFTNAYYYAKVVIFNKFYDICQASGADYEQIRKHLANNPNIGNSHTEIWHKGYRGAGGKCLPKDLDTLIQYLNQIGINSDLFELVRKNNQDL